MKNDTVNDDSDTANASLLALIVSNPRITAMEISQKLNIGIATAKRRLKKLKDSGFIERVGSDKSGYWRVK
ncbi:MAG: winged helix-turn-helix transcriptional regulator [Clostridia bacterium]|nr:winged helix-turn-helix transcriptional regulator [Clostridia bacterium]